MPKTQSNASLKSYMQEVEKVVETVETVKEPVIVKAEPVMIVSEAFDPPDIMDVPDHQPIVEKHPTPVERRPRIQPVVEKRPTPIVETKPPHVVEPLQEDVITKPEPINEAREMFYQSLLEKMDHLNDVRPISVVVETTDSHIERLLKIERSMLEMTSQCATSIKQRLDEEVMASREMINSLVVNRDMIDVLVKSQQKIVETQNAMVSVITALSLKIAAISTTPAAAPIVNVPAPVINIPAPVVNITESASRRITKTVERDEKGMITQVIEDSGSDD